MISRLQLSTTLLRFGRCIHFVAQRPLEQTAEHILDGGTVVFDLVHDRTYRREADRPLEIPAGAVVVPGTRPVRSGPGAAAGLSLYAPVIVKYRDEKTDTAARLEDLLR